jgi:hopanoid biosynthesis associated RND transporter like protein HpnN
VKNQIDEALARALARWVDAVTGEARTVALGLTLVTLGLLAYAVLNLGINSDNLRLVGEDFPARKQHLEFSELFPNLDAALLVVVDAETSELARESTLALAEQMRADTARFTEVYLPGGGDFFERNGLMYRSVDELDLFADQMARMQPVLAELERDDSIANLAMLVQRGLEEARNTAGADDSTWADILERVGGATVRVYDEYPYAVSWESMLLRGSSVEIATRRVIVAHPVLDFNDILAAGPALASIRGAAEELGLTPERGVRVRVTGNPVLNYEEMIGIAWDIGVAGIFCFALVVLVLYAALRSLRLVVAVVATLLAGLVWTAAFAAASVGVLNIISMTFAVLFIGLGVDFGIHLGMRYGSLIQKGLSHEEALHEATAVVGSSLVLCTFTTAIGFYAFVPTQYLAVSELGLIVGTGMFIILFLTLTLMPALLTSWLRLDPAKPPGGTMYLQHAWWSLFERHATAVRVAALLLAVGGLFLLPQARFDPNVVAMRDPTTESVQAFNDLLEQSGTASPWYINAIARDQQEARRLAAELTAVDAVSQTITLLDYLPEEQEEKLEILTDVAMLMDSRAGPNRGKRIPVDEQVEALRQLHDFLGLALLANTGATSPLQESMKLLRFRLAEFLARVEEDSDPTEALDTFGQIMLANLPGQMERLRAALAADEITLEDLPPQLVERMQAHDGQARIQIFPSETLQDEASFVRFVDGVREIAPRATGVAVNLIALGRVTRDSFTQALAAALAVILLLIFSLWRRLDVTLLVMAPLLLSAVLTGAAVVVLDTAFNFANVIVIPLMFGIGVDSAIHLVHQAREQGAAARSGALEDSLLGSTTARAVLFSALTTVVSFGTLAFSSHTGMASLGILLTVGMSLSVLSNLIVLPALISLHLAHSPPES